MAKKLRLRFVLISMLSLAAVLAIIMLTINLTNYDVVRRDADTLLDELQAGGGRFRGMEGDMPMPRGRDNAGQQQAGDETMPEGPMFRPNDETWNGHARFSAETPYETRYFVVSLAGDRYVTYMDRIAAVEESSAIAMAEQVLSGGKTRGYVGVYRYLVTDEGNTVLFVDCNRGLSEARYFLATSLIVSAAALAGMFILVFLFSKKAVQPTVEAYERQRQFVTEASHELKTPITIISANNEILQLEYGENESSDAIEHQVKRLSSMVKNMVSLARLDEAEHIAMGRVNLSECVTEHVDLYRNALTTDGRTLSADVDDTVEMEGNLDLLAQLTSILLDNAIKYAKTYTEVSLKKDKAVTLVVRNDAEGLTDGDKSRCFERFYRDVNVAQNVEGSGIGLAIAKQIVSLHKGTIAATAKDGVFTIMVTL